jgi:hypothetical protein
MIKPLDTLIALKMISLSGDVSSTDKRVAALLIDHFNRRTGQCDPSLDTMADLIGVDRRTVVRSISRLVGTGLFRKIRHGGKFHRNSYEPMWTRFSQLDDIWGERRKARRAKFVSPNLSLSEGRPCRSADDQDVTQTCLKNHFKETLRSAPTQTQQSALRESKKVGLAEFEGWSGARGTLKRLQTSIGEAACKSWFGNVEVVAYHEGIIVLSVSSAFYQSSIINRYEPQLLTCFRPDYPELFRIEVEIHGCRIGGDGDGDGNAPRLCPGVGRVESRKP